MSARGGDVRNAASSSQGQRHAKKLLAIVTGQLLEKKEKKNGKQGAQDKPITHGTLACAHILVSRQEIESGSCRGSQ